MAANRIQIQNALHKPYDRVLFSREVLSPVFSSGFTLNSSLVPASVSPNKSESAVIANVWIYGKIQLDDSTEITCYEVLLQPKVRIEQSKVAIQQYVRKLLTAGQAALINFVAPANKNVWRLTLVAKDSVLTDKGVKEKTTNAKRYTYLLGPSETCRTAAQRFEWLSTLPKITFEKLRETFEVEKLSDDFFKEYTIHYQNFCDYLQDSNYRKSVFNITFPANATKQEKDKASKPIRDFVKKLLGRIVFLYFVQKKSWLGASDTNYTDGLGDFIKQLFNKSGGNETFYSNWLTKLFFDTLNADEVKRPNEDFKMPDGKMVKVPFLNGGLFDKEEFDEHLLTFKSKLFHHPDFEDAILTAKSSGNARGFLDFLDAFNFTVYEDSPDDHTVAVDPEMLGHIFENLLEDNKDKGAFYTPKEIVHYMCQESLTEYLCTTLQLKDEVGEREAVNNLLKNKVIDDVLLPEIDELEKALDNVKICDPAIGSGAFPMGILQEIFSIKELIAYETNKEWKPAETKLNIIQNSVYGVDVEKGAVDIARLRFWLSLVVDEEKPKPLPNLDYKIVVGDSLISKFDGEIVEIDWDKKQFTSSTEHYVKEIQHLLTEIADKQKQYFNPNSKNKKQIRADIRNLKIELLINQLSFNKEHFKNKTPEKGGFMPTSSDIKHNTERELQIKGFDILIAKLKNLLKNPDEPFNHFDWKLDFPEVLNPYLVSNEKQRGFDIVIANPPYIGQKGNKALFEPHSKDRFFEKKMDYWYFFLHKSYSISKNSGVNTFITPNYWITTQGGKKLRRRLIEDYSIVEYINFNENAIFEAGVHTNIFLLKKNETPNQRIKCTIYQNKYSENIFSYRQNELNFCSDQKEIYSKWTGYVHFLPANVSGIINQLFNNCEKLCDNESEGEKKQGVISGKKVTNGICNINQGLVTGKDRYIDKNKNENNGVFILTKEEVSELSLNKDEKKLIKPFFKNSDVRRFRVETNPKHFILYVNKIEKEDELKKYTTVYKHLSSYKEVLKQRSINGVLQSAYQKGKWWALTTDRPNINFESEKILCPQRSNTNTFGYSKEEWFAASDVFYITLNKHGYSLKYIQSILTSKLTYFWLYYMGKRKGEALELTLEPLQFIPIKKTQISEQIPFTRIVNYILFLKEREVPINGDKLIPAYFEQIIDGMVYELYFPELLKKHNREIIKHMGELPEFTDSMGDEQKMKICKKVFDRLNDKEHPVRVNLFYMNSIPEIAIIEGKNENN
jgi:adenine-specific DNA-methyltransferase